MTRKLNIPVALYLSMIALAAATPTSAGAFAGVGTEGQAPKATHHTRHTAKNAKAVYIKTADRLCATINGELTPAVQAMLPANLPAAVANPAGVAPVVMAAANQAQITFRTLRATRRPGDVTGGNILVGYFNAESERLTASYNFGVDVANQQWGTAGVDNTTAGTAQTIAAQAAHAYGFKVCGR